MIGRGTKWSEIPLWVKVTPVVGLMVALSWAHYYLGYHDPHLLPVVQRLFFLPLFMASLLFGLAGGVVCAALLSLNCIPWVFQPDPVFCSRMDLALHLGLLFLTGIITGALVDRERREARNQRRREEMAMMGEAAAAVAHELKTPLVAIGGFALRMQRDLPPDHPNAEKLRIIVDQVSHMEKLLRDMLDFTRPLVLKREPQAMGVLVQEALALTSEAARRAGVDLVADLPAQEDKPLMDRSRLLQVVLNLIQNAVQASRPGDRVQITVRSADGCARLKVSDEGKGIDPDTLDQIFHPFYTTKHRGTGLGLAISRRIVEAHGGSIEVTSLPGQGSSFEIILPLSQA